ncbi:MAG: hypothetical protein DWB56_01520 [Candidatus Jettenia sp.]|uniref:Uncharacterized protein n=1 Tax=Candidatus Jettenia caeni TaxID=247490 RepID=I3IL95_9BACT|nr:hypothetical protein [Candidatus Jettenia sp. AMX1]MBC6927634.1 hypothetical protein [Candidatus Jettenia sp.]NUN22048.1 hypothetical protein [Candidatus Jettenia caeni]KAA0250094.1 MAG: hypothetical protein EDM77_06470 [Candidatus Jettenia sp. AMX1]MCE7880177.1 hypothetical protein [Candidatus Jettenia sp. AMX1]MCQ3926617.1 hypothetical protein [Candidatus Jettenia sp.]
MSEKPRPIVRLLIACLFFLIAVLLNILLPLYWHTVPEIVKHLLLIFSAIMCVHIMEYTYLWWEIFGHIKDILKETLQTTNRLIDDNRISLEKYLQTTNRLIGSAALCGLTNIYSTRKDVKSDIYDAIENAEKRVWLLGITFSENLHLDELLSTLQKKISHGLDVKILLLDALECPAIFRTFLESTASEAAKIIHADRTKTQSPDPYFHQRLYSDFVHACDRLKSYPNVEPAVRFYTHSPTCWMMIVDNVAHFQPYTFGRSASQHSANLCIGANMPVFKFQIQPKGKPFEILEDHFLKLWLTSNLDLFHIEAKIADRNRIVRDIFDSHSSWLKQVYEVLYTPKDSTSSVIDQYKVPSQLWRWDQPSLSISLQDNKTLTRAAICDYSCKGISLEIESALALCEGQIILLQGEPPTEPLEANFVMNHFLRIKRFIIRQLSQGSPSTIRLEAAPAEENNKPGIDSRLTAYS